jgi:hypothetical protein
MMSSSMWLLQYECEVFNFFKKTFKFYVVGVLNQDPYQQKKFQLTHPYKYKGGI